MEGNTESMSSKFKLYGYLEGFDVHDDEVVRCPSEPSTKEKAFILGLLLLPVLLMLGAAFAQAH